MSSEEEETTPHAKGSVIASIAVSGICLLICVYECSIQYTRTRALLCLACATTSLFCVLAFERLMINSPSETTFQTIVLSLMTVYVWAIAVAFLDLGRRFYPPGHYRTFIWKTTIFLAALCSAVMLFQAVWVNIADFAPLTMAIAACTYALSWMVGISGFAYAFVPLLMFRRRPQAERTLSPRNVSVGLWYIFTTNTIGTVYIAAMIYMIQHGKMIYRPAAGSTNAAIRAVFVTVMSLPPPRCCLRLIQRFWFGEDCSSDNLSALTEQNRTNNDMTNESREGMIERTV